MNNHRKYIEFLLNGELQQLYFDTSKDITPITTLLQYLRANESRRGTKEGCAEGDCGACTIVLAEDIDGKLDYKACNSCLILLPQIHGKQVITVEDLQDGSNLHPVQSAFIEKDASQCGFCTPGFVMSLFALYKSTPKANNSEITETFSGNLCRCTGYESILKASHTALENYDEDTFTHNELKIINSLKSINKQNGFYENIEQKYYQPTDTKSALIWIDKNPDFEIISGSTDVALRVTKKKETIPALMDLGQIDELKTINQTADYFYIGSQATLQTIKETVGKSIPSFDKILSVFGSKQIRNLATLGGNLGSASPIGDTLPLLMALDAKILLKNINGNREILASDFITGYRQTKMKPNELIVQIIVPKPSNKVFIDIEKVSKRLDLDISTVSVAIRLKQSANKVEEIKIIFGGLSAFTKHATNVESFMQNRLWTKDNVKKASAELEKDFQPITDARASSYGRMQLAKNLLVKLWINSQENLK